MKFLAPLLFLLATPALAASPVERRTILNYAPNANVSALSEGMVQSALAIAHGGGSESEKALSIRGLLRRDSGIFDPLPVGSYHGSTHYTGPVAVRPVPYTHPAVPYHGTIIVSPSASYEPYVGVPGHAVTTKSYSYRYPAYGHVPLHGGYAGAHHPPHAHANLYEYHKYHNPGPQWYLPK